MKRETHTPPHPPGGTSYPAPADLIEPEMFATPGELGERELDADTRAGVQNMTKDLQHALAFKLPRYTEAALYALAACTTPEQRQGVKLCYIEQIRKLAAAMVEQVESQFNGHMCGFSPFADCTEGINIII